MKSCRAACATASPYVPGGLRGAVPSCASGGEGRARWAARRFRLRPLTSRAEAPDTSSQCGVRESLRPALSGPYQSAQSITRRRYLCRFDARCPAGEARLLWTNLDLRQSDAAARQREYRRQHPRPDERSFRGFVYDRHFLIFVNDIERDIFRFHARERRTRNIYG